MEIGYSEKDIRCFVDVASEYFKIDLLSNTRLDNIVSVRQSLFYVLRSRGIPYSVIGKAFNKNHATVIHGHKKVTDYINIKDKATLALYKEAEMLAKEYFNESPIVISFSTVMRLNIYKNRLIEFIKESEYLLPYDTKEERIAAAEVIIKEVLKDETKSK